jgi:hypothetical protein
MDAAAEDKTCVFKADAKKIHLTVWDEDSEEDRQGKIFEGALESGERKKIQSTTGRTCKSGNTIRVP